MAELEGPMGAGAGGGGPPSDVGTGTPVVVDKANGGTPAAVTPPATPPATPAATPPAATPPKPATAAPPAATPPATPPTTPAATPPAATPGKTAADGADPDAPPAATPADWPADWRQKMVGDDPKALKALEKYQSPKDVANALRALTQRMSSGELKKALPTNFTAEELAEYRKANGIPEKPEDYDVNLGEGFVWGEADTPVLDSFREHALGANLPNEAVKKVLGWYVQQQQAQAEARAQQDENARVLTIDALRAEWGAEYAKNSTAMKNYFEGMGPEIYAAIMNARGPDGNYLGNNPAIHKFFAARSMAENPHATLVPDVGQTQAQTAIAEYQALAKESADKTGVYWRGSTAAAKQARMNELITNLMKSGHMDEKGQLRAA
jgi:hypothetical protein